VDSTGVLYIADQLNNRVLEFLLPSVDTTADAVFGQGGHFNTTKCDNGGISKNSLCAPVGLAADSSNNLYVADEENSRVLEYNHPPANDTTADEVFGQGVSFITALCNGGGATPTAKTLCGPTGVALDATGRLYVADERNSRVLEYATPATSATAIKVFGQGGSMTTAKCNLSGTVDANGLCRPGGLSLDTSGNLYVTDDVNNRVLRYNSAAIGNTTADVVLGQPDFAHSDPNAVDASAFGSGAGLAMAGTVDITALGAVAIDNSTGRLYVADTNNNRVLGFNNAASFANGAPANIVIGQQTFFAGTSKACNGNGATSSTLCLPTGVAVDAQGNLYVADREDNRVLKFLKPVTTGEAASLVIGQPNFTANKSLRCGCIK
jgi:sugar lactone lactonase YvrE